MSHDKILKQEYTKLSLSQLLKLILYIIVVACIFGIHRNDVVRGNNGINGCFYLCHFSHSIVGYRAFDPISVYSAEVNLHQIPQDTLLVHAAPRTQRLRRDWSGLILKGYC